MTPDGESIAVVKIEPKFHGDRFVQYQKGSLELISREKGIIRILDDSVNSLNSLSFSADGRSIFYTPRLTNGSGFAETQLVSRTLSVDNDINVIARGKNMPYYVQKSVSPDGRYLVYSAVEDLFLIPIAKDADPVMLLQKN